MKFLKTTHLGKKATESTEGSPSTFSRPTKAGEQPQPKQTDTILVAQDTAHSGALHGLISNGGKKSVGNYIIEVVNQGTPYVTIQIYQAALGVKPRVQSYVRTKKVVEKKTVYKKPEKEKLKVESKIEQDNLFD